MGKNSKPTKQEIIGKSMRFRLPVESVRALDEDKRTLEVAFSSDAEIEQFWRTIIVLEHTNNACLLDRLNNGGALLFNHNRNAHIGVVESARVDADGKARAVVRFSRSELGEEKFQDVKDNILRHVSVGFEVHELKLVETRDDDIDVYRATSWEPFEISLVTIPADDSVGVGRSHGAPINEADTPAPEPQKVENRNMGKDTNPKPDGGAPTLDETAVRDEAMKAERDRANAILHMGRQYNAPDEAETFVREGKSVDQFAQHLLKLVDAERQQPTPDETNEGIGMSENDIANYSFVRVLRALDPSNRKAQEEAAFELEASEAAAQKLGREASGIVVPVDVLSAPIQRTYTTDGAAAPHGGELVGTTHLASSFIDLLRVRCMLMNMSNQMAGLVGNIDIPKHLAGASAYVVGEEEDVTESAGDFGSVNLTPHTIGAYSQISRRLLMQSSPDVEALIRSDLAFALAVKIDWLGLYGTGTDEPRGIKNTTGVNAVTFATAGQPTHSEIVQMESEVSADNADVNSMAYLLNARMRGHCKTTPKFANTDKTLWEEGNTLNGYHAGVTNQITNNDMFFGNFADVIVGMWGGLELNAENATRITRGGMRVVAMQDIDVALRHAESFCYGTSV